MRFGSASVAIVYGGANRLGIDCRCYLVLIKQRFVVREVEVTIFKQLFPAYPLGGVEKSARIFAAAPFSETLFDNIALG